jgi:DNA-binding response OmpR family regulator
MMVSGQTREAMSLRMATNARILVVDDEPDLREMLSEYLTGHGFAVTAVADGAAARAVVASERVHLAILDIRMPGEDGLSLARHLREHYRLAIIMLTAANEVVDRVIGLEVGADDYVAKPFDPRELLARIRTLLRRFHAPASTKPELSGLTLGPFVLDLQRRTVLHQDGHEIAVSMLEFALLELFARHPNQVLTRDDILNQAHAPGPEQFDRSVDIRIARLRRKIERVPDKPEIIKTVRGAGYVYAKARDS